MSVPREGDWLDVAPFQDVSVESERALFVDVGGSIGHQCARLKQKFPDLKGRIVLQDLEETIKNAPPIEGVEMMSHDFFKAQPIKGKNNFPPLTLNLSPYTLPGIRRERAH